MPDSRARMPLVPVGGPLSPRERAWFSRHLMLPGVGDEGQRRLRQARVLVVGAGGLGSPVLMYLAAAGIGRITLIDDDVVESSNLHRQVIHRVDDVGVAKVDSAVRALGEHAPWTEVEALPDRLSADNVLDLVADHDVVVDGADNFPTRYLVSDACTRLAVPHVWGSVFQHDAQVSVWWAGVGPCYRCVFPTPPPEGLVPSCATGGVLGAMCGVVGSLMAQEAIKLVVGGAQTLVGRVAVYDAWRTKWSEVAVTADPQCVSCGDGVDLRAPLGISTGAGQATDPAVAEVPTVSVAEVAAAIDERAGGGADCVVIDVREADERALMSIPGSIHIPLAKVREAGPEVLAQVRGGIPAYVYCASGVRSAQATATLRDNGIEAFSVDGGMHAWASEIDPSVTTSW